MMFARFCFLLLLPLAFAQASDPQAKPHCTLCQMGTMMKANSPFFELAKSLHKQQTPPGPHWYCDWVWYYDVSASNFTYWEKLPSSKWAVKFSPASYCTVWTVQIKFDLKKNSPFNFKDTLDIFVNEANSPYTQVFKQYFLVNHTNIEEYYPIYPPLGTPYSTGNPILNTKRDFYVGFKMRGPNVDSVLWFFKTPAINPSRSVKFLTNTSIQTASQATGASVDMLMSAELCLHIPFAPPVELETFSAQATERGVALQWETASETNNYGFDVQRALSRDGPWESRTFVSGHGTSTTRRAYTFEDAFDRDETLSRGVGVYWYRLRQIDYDGTVEVLHPLMVALDDGNDRGFALDQNFPNPVSQSAAGRTTIRYRVPHTENVTLRVFDAHGREVETLVDGVQAAGTHTLQWNASRLTPGVFYMTLASDRATTTRKMLLVR